MAPLAAPPDEPIIVVVGLTAGWHKRRQARRYFKAVFGRRAFLPWIPYIFGLRASAAWLSLRVRHHLKRRNCRRIHLIAYIGGGVLVRWLHAKGERWPIGRAVWDRSPTQERVAPALASRIPSILLTLAGYRAIVDLSRAFAAALPFPPSELGSGLIVETGLSALARRLGIGNADADLSQEALDALLPCATATISLPLSHDDVYSHRRFLDEAATFLTTGGFSRAQPGAEEMSPKAIQTLPRLLRVSAERFGNRPAIASREGLRTRTLTYRALADAAESVAADLVDRRGLCPGDRVILLNPSGVRTTATLFGLFRAGLIAVPLDLHSTADFVEAVRQKTEAAAIISGDSFPVPPGLKEIPLGSVDLEGPPAANLPEPRSSDVAEIVFTSGTTGAPKGVALTHGNIVSDLVAGSRVVPEGEAMDLVSILPLSHMFEQLVGLFLPILKGGSIHYSPSLRPSAILAEMARRRVTGMAVVPRFLGLLMSAAEQRMLQRGLGWIWRLQHRVAPALPISVRRIVFLPFHRRLGGRLRFFVCGGARLPPELMRAWERTGVRIIEGYGATECSPVIAANSFDHRVPGSVGHPLEGVDARISEEGELQVRGPNVFRAYWHDTERTTAAFTADGWYHTDDIAEFDPDGSLRIAGRLSDRIVLASGMNVFPEDVETALAVQPGVKECVVLGLAEPKGGERVHAVVRPAEGADEMQAGRSVERANASLASHQRITSFTLWSEEFPKTALQKVRRAALRAALEGRIPSSAEPVVDSVGRAALLLRKVLQIGPATITPSTRLEADLGLDSIGRMELAALIEQETGRDIPEETITGLATAGELAELLASPGPAATSMRFPRWPRGRSARMLRPLLQPLLLFLPHRIFARPYAVLGREALADIEGPCLIIANHASHADTVSILRALPVGLRARTAVAAAGDYFFAHILAGSLVGLLLNAFKFSREGRVRQSLDHCGLLADEGWSILIYPEGTRSPDGRLLPFKAGIGLLATGLGVPIVPVSVTGGARLLPKGARWPRRAAVSVCFGPPVTIPPGMKPDEATELLHQAVAAHLPEELLSGREESLDGR